MTDDQRQETSALAMDLMKATTRLRARLRVESVPEDGRWTWAQLTTLTTLVDRGPHTATELAKAEYVRRQSMAATISALKAGNYVDTGPDAADRRKTMVFATQDGVDLSKSIPAAREAWLEGAMQRMLTPSEYQILGRAAQIMARLADA